MKRTRKWAFVSQEAGRLAALGLKPLDIAKRLGVNKSTVTRWIADGKLRRSTAPKPPMLVAQANQTPSEWAAAVRKDYDLDATDDQLVMLAEAALGLSMDATVAPHVRMNASGRFQAIVRQLQLVMRGSTAETVQAPVAAQEPEKLASRRVRRQSGDPRGHPLDGEVMVLMVPCDVEPYPTLGGQVCDFIEQNLVFGPGDLRGKPAVLDDEKRALVYRLYEVYPRKHRFAGRRRFKRAGLSLRKGSAKTELAAFIAACELHPEGPVRCTGFTKGGEPIGGPVTEPYIPMVAYTEEQSEDLAYGALRIILELSLLKDDFDIGLERIMRKRGDGKAVALAAAPDSRDGALTTFQHFDETHRMTSQRLINAHTTMLANIPKRMKADAWSLETTTMPEPGTGSVAESTMDYARSVAEGKAADARLFFFHRQASDGHDLTTIDGRRDAVIEASGPVAGWSDIESIVEQWNNPRADLAYLERVWLNRLVKSGTQAFDVLAWNALTRPGSPVKPGDLITIGFDGAVFFDSTGIICTHVATGYQWKAGLWECPPGYNAGDPSRKWQVPSSEVDATIRMLFKTYSVWRFYADPPKWESWVAAWKGEFDGEEERVIEWWTNRRRPMTGALLGFQSAISEGLISHSGDLDLVRHLGNSRRANIDGWRDEQGNPLWLIQKERPDSPHKIDLAMAAVLSWEARTDAIAAGATEEKQFQMLSLGGRSRS